MRGPEDARKLTLGWLEEHMPATVYAIAERLELDTNVDTAGHLSPPAEWSASPLPRVEEFPALFIAPIGAPRVRLVDRADDGGRVYAVAYRQRVYVICRGDTFDEVADRRDRLMLALRETLLAAPTLGDAGVTIDDTTWAESYSEVEDDSLGRSLAGGYAEFELDVEETLAERRPAVGTVATIGVIVEPRHPALD